MHILMPEPALFFLQSCRVQMWSIKIWNASGPSSTWGHLKVLQGPWTSLLLPLIASSIKKKWYTNSYIYNYNEHGYIAGVHCDVLCICGVHCMPVCPWRDPSYVALLQVSYFSLKCFFLWKIFLTWFEGLNRRSHNCANCKALRGNNVCDLN